MSKASKKKHKGAKRTNGGEAKKGAANKKQSDEEYIADAQDNKRGNLGPSGQGGHRGRERRNLQTKASGRDDASSIGV